MQNLQVSQEKWLNLKSERNNEKEVIVAATYDAVRDRMFLASDSLNVYGLNVASGQVERVVSFLEEVSDDVQWLKKEDRIICMEYLLEKEALVLGFAMQGIVFLDPSSLEVEEIHMPTGGLVALALSPDGELLVFVTGDGQIHVMTQYWDLLYNLTLDQPPGSRAPGLVNPGAVQVSWRGDGKYFTTLEVLNGLESEGKISTNSSIKVWETETGALHSSGEPLVHMQPALSWNPVGSRIATVCLRPDTHESPLVVLFERNGLKRSSFDVLAPPDANVVSLQWNANSELLAILVRCREVDSVQVWKISNFHWYLKQEWQFSPRDYVNMFWHPEKPLQLFCWTAFGCVGRITLCWKSAMTGGSTAFVIDGNNLLVTFFPLAIIPPPMCTFKVNFPSPVQTFATMFENKRCVIAAVLSDGSPSVVVLPATEKWSDLGGDISALRAKSYPDLDFCNFRQISWLGPKTLLGSLSCSLKPIAKDITAFSSGGTEMVCPWDNVDSGSEYIVQLELQPCEGTSDDLLLRDAVSLEKWALKVFHYCALDQPVLAIASKPSNFKENTEAGKVEAYVQLADGSVVLYSSDLVRNKLLQQECCLNPSSVRFASPSLWMQAIIQGNADRKVVLIGLDSYGRLQVDDQLVCNDCTSLTIHESSFDERESKVIHVVFTTRKETLNVINLDEILSGRFMAGEVKDISSIPGVKRQDRPTTLVGKSRANKLTGVHTSGDSLRIRPMWERGALLVAALGGTDTAVILETIRGNLETIYPRGLVLGAIASALAQDNFMHAMLLARRHHLNLNVIVDYKGWKEFCVAAGGFVKQVKNLAHITELVQALNNENIMETTYKNVIPVYRKPEFLQAEVHDNIDLKNRAGESVVLGEKITNKVSGVLRAIRCALQNEVADSPKRELCILTTLALSDPPEHESALIRVKRLRDAELKGILEWDTSLSQDSLTAEAAIKHLIWLTDADVVFNIALGLYDLYLAAIVASHSQKDPKEFLPLLETLKNMGTAEMKYTVDCRLGRFERALYNCADMGEEHFSKCIQLVKDNPSLFPCGLRLFNVGDKKNILLEAWGDYLVDSGKFEDAGATFCACSRFEKALNAYRLGGLWERVMTMAGRLGKTSAEISELAIELQDELQAMGRPIDAAKLALDYRSDVDGAITLLLDAHAWSEVARLAYLYKKRDFIKVQLEPSILENARLELSKLNGGAEKIGKYLARFLTLYEQRLIFAAKLKADEENWEATEDDASSDISFANSTHSNVSGLSGLSAYTLGSSRMQSTTTSASGKGARRQARNRKSEGRRIRAGSVGEERALSEYMKGMALGKSSLDEYHVLLEALLQLGHESVARSLQEAVSNFISAQKNAVQETEEKLSDGTVSTETLPNPTYDSWQWEVLK